MIGIHVLQIARPIMKSDGKFLPKAVVSRHVAAHATQVRRWIAEEVEGWYRRRLAFRELAWHLERSTR